VPLQRPPGFRALEVRPHPHRLHVARAAAHEQRGAVAQEPERIEVLLVEWWQCWKRYCSELKT
jgi:hypothetical protein